MDSSTAYGLRQALIKTASLRYFSDKVLVGWVYVYVFRLEGDTIDGFIVEFVSVRR